MPRRAPVHRPHRLAAPIHETRPGSAARGYGWKWRKASEAYRVHHPVCQADECRRPAEVVDHVVPHRGDLRLFWDAGNWQSLCKRCHDRKTGRGL